MGLVAKKVLPGIPRGVWAPREIRECRKKLDASQEEFARILGVVASTVYRWEKGEVVPDRKTAEKLGRLKEVIALLDRHFQANGRAAWFVAPDPRLDGDRPMDLLGLPSGVKRIKAFIGSYRAGDFA